MPCYPLSDKCRFFIPGTTGAVLATSAFIAMPNLLLAIGIIKAVGIILASFMIAGQLGKCCFPKKAVFIAPSQQLIETKPEVGFLQLIAQVDTPCQSIPTLSPENPFGNIKRSSVRIKRISRIPSAIKLPPSPRRAPPRPSITNTNIFEPPQPVIENSSRPPPLTGSDSSSAPSTLSSPKTDQMSLLIGAPTELTGPSEPIPAAFTPVTEIPVLSAGSPTGKKRFSAVLPSTTEPSVTPSGIVIPVVDTASAVPAVFSRNTTPTASAFSDDDDTHSIIESVDGDKSAIDFDDPKIEADAKEKNTTPLNLNQSIRALWKENGNANFMIFTLTFLDHHWGALKDYWWYFDDRFLVLSKMLKDARTELAKKEDASLKITDAEKSAKDLKKKENERFVALLESSLRITLATINSFEEIAGGRFRTRTQKDSEIPLFGWPRLGVYLLIKKNGEIGFESNAATKDKAAKHYVKTKDIFLKIVSTVPECPMDISIPLEEINYIPQTKTFQFLPGKTAEPDAKEKADVKITPIFRQGALIQLSERDDIYYLSMKNFHVHIKRKGLVSLDDILTLHQINFSRKQIVVKRGKLDGWFREKAATAVANAVCGVTSGLSCDSAGEIFTYTFPVKK